MTKEKKHFLLQTFLERDFTIEVILQILSAAALYCDYRKNWLAKPMEYGKIAGYWKAELERELRINGLDSDFTTSDFIDEETI